MTTTTVTWEDIEYLRSLLRELTEAGRKDEAAKVLRIHSIVQSIYMAENFDDEEDDPDFIRQMEEAERDIAEGRLIPHEEVVRRLQALDDATD